MVKHIILWTLKEELSDAEKAAIKAGIKEGLEGLVGKVPGLLDVKVHIDGRLASSNADVMLDSKSLLNASCPRGGSLHKGPPLHSPTLLPGFRTVADGFRPRSEPPL